MVPQKTEEKNQKAIKVKAEIRKNAYMLSYHQINEHIMKV